MFEIHKGLLWVGNAFDIREEPRRLFDAGIGAVVDVAYEEPVAQLPRQLIYFRFPINDGGGNEPSILVQAVQSVADLLANETGTIIACSAGSSRSPTIAAFALAAHLDGEANEVLEHIASIKSLEVKGPLWNDVASVFSRVRRRV